MRDWRAEVRGRVRPGGPGRREGEAVEELAEHLADRYREALDRGESEERAVAAALAELEPLKRSSGPEPPSPRRSSMFEQLWRDVHHGLRLMRRAPAFTAVAVLTLALAIGANTAVFSLVNAVLLRPLPFPDASRLAVAHGRRRDVKDGRLDEEANPHTYTPLLQEGPREIEGFLRSINVVLRARDEPRSLPAAARREVAAVDPSLAVANPRLLEQDVRAAVAPQRFQLTLVAAFAALGLLLAAVGVYGILVHFVGQQTREIGVRMALGARAGDVLRGVVAEGLRLAAVGAAGGLAASLAVARLLRGMLFGVGVYDPAAFLAAPVLLGLVALLACGVPAWRAARVDPVVALRQE